MKIEDKDILEIIENALSYYDHNEIHIYSSFNSLDVDDLDKVEIILECERRYGMINEEYDYELEKNLFKDNVYNFIKVLKQYYLNFS